MCNSFNHNIIFLFSLSDFFFLSTSVLFCFVFQKYFKIVPRSGKKIQHFYSVPLPFPDLSSHFYFLQHCYVMCCDGLQCAFFFFFSSCSALEYQFCDSEKISK